jgi:hypothetical protein
MKVSPSGFIAAPHPWRDDAEEDAGRDRDEDAHGEVGGEAAERRPGRGARVAGSEESVTEAGEEVRMAARPRRSGRRIAR